VNTYSYDLRVRDCSRHRLAGFARTLAGAGTVSVQPVDAPADGATAAYRLVVRPGDHGTDAATIVATLAWMLSATGRLLSVRPRA